MHTTWGGLGRAAARAKPRVLIGAYALVALMGAVLAPAASAASSSPPFTECPPAGMASSCGVLVILNPDATTTIQTDAASGNPFDGSDGTTVGVLNNTGAPIDALALSASVPIFGFDGGGMCAADTPAPLPAGCPFDRATADAGSDYAGPGISFSGIGSGGGAPGTSGMVTFAASCSGGGSCAPTPSGLGPGSTAYFSLEGDPTTATFRPHTVAPPSPNPNPNPNPIATPALTGQPTVGPSQGNVSDSVTLSGAASPGGTLLFELFRDGTCAGQPFATAATQVSGNGSYSSGPVRAGGPGTYNWVVRYSGDAANAAVATPCGGQTMTVPPAPTTSAPPTPSPPGAAGPRLLLTASAAQVGGSISSIATLAGATSPRGTLTFRLFAGPDCRGAPVTSAVIKVRGIGNYSSGPLPTRSAGRFNWVVSYTGDGTNAPTATACGAYAVSIAKAVVTISAGTVSGSPPKASASLVGGYMPSGSISFSLYPSSACTGQPLGGVTQSVTGDGTYTALQVPTTAPGPYYVATSYSGDAENDSATAGCTAGTVAVASSPAPPAAPVGGDNVVPNVAGGPIILSRLRPGADPTTIAFLVSACFAVALCVGGVAFTWRHAQQLGVAGDALLLDAPPGDGLRSGLLRSSRALSERLGPISARHSIDEQAREEIEDALIRADLGAQAIGAIMEGLRRQKVAPEALTAGLRRQLLALLDRRDRHLTLTTGLPSIWFVAGVGTDDQVAAAKLAAMARVQDVSAVVVAEGAEASAMPADADGQEATSAPPTMPGLAAALPQALAEAHAAATEHRPAVAIVEASTGQQSPALALAELQEVRRVAAGERAKVSEVLLLLDARQGHACLERAGAYGRLGVLTGIVLLNLDSTGRGGIAVALEQELDVPIKAVALDGAGDLEVFDPSTFVAGIISDLGISSP